MHNDHRTATLRLSTPLSGLIDFRDHANLAFQPAEYLARLDQVLSGMKARGIDVLLVRGPENITYLTGYETPGYYGYHCLILAPDIEPVLIGRALEVASNTSESSWLTRTVFVPDDRTPEAFTAQTLTDLGMGRARLGVEQSGYFLTVREFKALAEALPGAELKDGSGLVEEARMIKSETEIAYIRAATAIADATCLAAIDAVGEGVSENDIAAAAHQTWCSAGAEYTGLPNFITTGRRTSVVHGTWRGRVMTANDVGSFEMAASKSRYAGAVYRGVMVGDGHPTFLHMGRTCISALEATLDAIRPGAIAAQVDEIGRSIIRNAGYGPYHRHRLAYSIGLNYPPDWGEGQIISIRPGEMRQLRPNMTFHVVPGFIKDDEELGHCTSATVRVTETGCEVLNTLPIEVFRR